MRKTLALLAYLSLSPQNPTRETLASLFWPEHDQQHALANLRRNLFSLAKSLPPGLLGIDREKIGFQKVEGLRVDVEEFGVRLAYTQKHPHPNGTICSNCVSALETAVAIYKGDFLEGFNLKDCPEFDEWQFFQAETLRQELASALQRLVHGHSASGEAGRTGAIPYARQWLALDPLHEPAHRQLMQLFAWSGRREAALRQYREWYERRVLGCPIERWLEVRDRDQLDIHLDELYAQYQHQKQLADQHGGATAQEVAEPALHGIAAMAD